MKLKTPKEVEKFIEKTANEYFTKPIEIAGNTCIETRKDINIYNFDKVAPTGVYLILKSDIEKYQRKIKGMRKSRIHEVAEPPLYLLEMLPSEILQHVNSLEDILQLERHKFMLDKRTALTQTDLVNYALLNHCETDAERVELAKELNKYVEGKQKDNGVKSGRSNIALLDLWRIPKTKDKALNENGEILKAGNTSIETPFEYTSQTGLTYSIGKLGITGVTQTVNRFIMLNIDPVQIRNDETALKVKFTLEDYINWRGLERNKNTYKAQRKLLRNQLDILTSKRIAFKEKRNAAFMNYIEFAEIRNGEITVSIAPTFKQCFLCSKDPVTKELTGAFNYIEPTILGRLDVKKHPYTIGIYYKLFSQSNMNTGDQNEYILSVEKLLEYLQVDTSTPLKYLNRDILTNIERDLNELENKNILTWDYSHSKGEPLTDDEQAARLDKEGNYKALPYQISKECYIYWNWTDEGLINYFKDHKEKRDKVKTKKIEARKAKDAEKEKSKRRIDRKTENLVAKAHAEKILEAENQ